MDRKEPEKFTRMPGQLQSAYNGATGLKKSKFYLPLKTTHKLETAVPRLNGEDAFIVWEVNGIVTFSFLSLVF